MVPAFLPLLLFPPLTLHLAHASMPIGRRASSKPDTFCVDIGLFTDESATRLPSGLRSHTALRINEVPFARRTVGEWKAVLVQKV